MPAAPYTLILAQTAHEGARYVRRVGLPRGRWRIVAKASSIAGIRKAHVHILPGFHLRPDRHAILGVLRYADCQIFDVEMPLTEAEQLVLDATVPMPPSARELEVAYRYNRLRDLVTDGEHATEESLTAATEAEIVEALEEPAPKQRRRSLCGECGTKHIKGEPCPRTDGAQDAPAPGPIFD